MTFKSSRIALTLMFLLCLSTFSFAATKRGILMADRTVTKRGVILSDRTSMKRGVILSDRTSMKRGVILSDRIGS